MSEDSARRLNVLGGAIILGDGAPLGGAGAHRHRIALLTLLARHQLPVSRDKLIAFLWPERDTEAARNLLKVAVHGLRKVLGEDAIRSVGDQLALDLALVSCDVADFDRAIAAKDLATAASLYGGVFLDGFFLKEAPEFDQWVETERTQLAATYARVIEQLASDADARGDAHEAARWYRVLAAHDPLRADVAMRLMRALAATGDSQSAIRHATVFATLRESAELDVEPSVAQLAHELSTAPTPAPRAASYDEAPVATAATSERRAKRLPWMGIGASLAIAVIVVVGAARARTASSRAAATKINSNAVAIFPFRVSGADPSLAYLGDGMAELLAAEFTGDGGPSALDPATVARAVGREGDSTANRELTMALGRRLGAGRVLTGSVVGTPQRMTVNATLLDAESGELLASAMLVAGSADSLPKIIGAVAAKLLSRDAGTWRLSAKDPGTTSTDALRSFIDGRAQYRAGRADDAFRSFAHALDLDSTFVLAAYWLTVNAKIQRPLSETTARRAYELAWSARSRLGADRRELLEAMLGAKGPGVSQSYADFLRAIERTSVNQPTSPEAWILLGDLYFHRGSLAGYPDWAARARAAFERGVSLDTLLGAVSHLASLAYRDHDMKTHARWLAQLERIGPEHSLTLREQYAAAIVGSNADGVRTARERWVRTGDAYRDSYDGFPWAVGIMPSSELDSLIATLTQLARTDEERRRAI